MFCIFLARVFFHQDRCVWIFQENECILVKMTCRQTSHVIIFLSHATISFENHVCSFPQPAFQICNGRFTTLVIWIVSAAVRKRAHAHPLISRSRGGKPDPSKWWKSRVAHPGASSGRIRFIYNTVFKFLLFILLFIH